jgi:hypothetical protein
MYSKGLCAPSLSDRRHLLSAVSGRVGVYPTRGLPPAPWRGSSPHRCVRANVDRTPSQKVVKRMSEQCRSNPCETCAAGTADHPRLVGIIPERALLPVSRLNPTSCSNLPATVQRQGGVG